MPKGDGKSTLCKHDMRIKENGNRFCQKCFSEWPPAVSNVYKNNHPVKFKKWKRYAKENLGKSVWGGGR